MIKPLKVYLKWKNYQTKAPYIPPKNHLTDQSRGQMPKGSKKPTGSVTPSSSVGWALAKSQKELERNKTTTKKNAAIPHKKKQKNFQLILLSKPFFISSWLGSHCGFRRRSAFTFSSTVWATELPSAGSAGSGGSSGSGSARRRTAGRRELREARTLASGESAFRSKGIGNRWISESLLLLIKKTLIKFLRAS